MIKMQVTIKTEQEKINEIMKAIEQRRQERLNKQIDYNRVTGV